MLEIVPSTLRHVEELGQTMRVADQVEAARLCIKPGPGVYWSYRHGLLRRTALVDGAVAAMWGVGGTPLGRIGRPFLLTAPCCETVSPIRFARVYFEEVRRMLDLFPILENYVDASYTASVRLLGMAGFSLDEPRPVGPQGFPFRRFWMVA